MINATWKYGVRWSSPELKPYCPLSLQPTASCLHYATEFFEGLKAYRGYDSKLHVFGIDHNVARLRPSASRTSLPVFEPEEVKKLIIRLFNCLYVRPTIIGTSPQLGVQAPKEAMLFIVLAFMLCLNLPPGGLRLYSFPEDAMRNWVGGFGYAQISANYGPLVMVLNEAAARGGHQVLWIYGKNGECTEAGGCNFFVVWVCKDGFKELIMALLDDKTILDGVTRRSVTECKFMITEVIDAAAGGRLLESFAAGTAYFISAVSRIHHRGKDIEVSMDQSGKGGEITTAIKTWLSEIMYVETVQTEHEWATVVSTEA
ncbi:hypothetical protein CEP53_015268 [Fusarium sp. AF-6]|nr:hypothetical protein CEP53_015268 [Fusarium sp. AF-6]